MTVSYCHLVLLYLGKYIEDVGRLIVYRGCHVWYH